MAREMLFKMERTGLLDEGERVTLTEGTLPSCYYYTLDGARARSLAMSANVPFTERLRVLSGVVKKIEENDRGYYVTVVLDDKETVD